MAELQAATHQPSSRWSWSRTSNACCPLLLKSRVTMVDKLGWQKFNASTHLFNLTSDSSRQAHTSLEIQPLLRLIPRWTRLTQEGSWILTCYNRHKDSTLARDFNLRRDIPLNKNETFTVPPPGFSDEDTRTDARLCNANMAAIKIIQQISIRIPSPREQHEIVRHVEWLGPEKK